MSIAFVDIATGRIDAVVGTSTAGLSAYKTGLGLIARSVSEGVSPQTHYFDGQAYSKGLVLLGADKSTISADGADAATVSVEVDDSPASIGLEVGGNTVEVPLIDGAGEIEITSSTAAAIEISPTDTVHYQGAALFITAE